MSPIQVILSIIFMVIGGYSITLKPEVVKKMHEDAKAKNIVIRSILNKFLKPLRYSNSLIGRSVEKNSVILFGWAILILFIYYLIIGLIFFFIKSIIYSILQMTAVFSLAEAFSLLFGAGIVSTIVWLKRLKEKEEDSLKAKISELTRAILLFIILSLWSLGEIYFLGLSPDLAFVDGVAPPVSGFFQLVIIILGVFGGIVVYLLIKWSVSSKKARIIILVTFYPLFILFLFFVVTTLVLN
jgi:ABC-type multidrug transport system fused ATPase/permease subunit